MKLPLLVGLGSLCWIGRAVGATVPRKRACSGALPGWSTHLSMHLSYSATLMSDHYLDCFLLMADGYCVVLSIQFPPRGLFDRAPDL